VRSPKRGTEAIPSKDAIETAWKIHGALADWTGKVDAKASFTLAIESALIAAIGTLSASGRLFTQRDRWWEETGYWTGVGLIAIGVFFAIRTVRPRLRRSDSKQESRENFIYFGHLRHWNEKDLTKALCGRDPLPMLSRQLINMSKIAWQKHRRVQYSLAFASVGAVVAFATGLSIYYL
jgi:hypothetical protein